MQKQQVSATPSDIVRALSGIRVPAVAGEYELHEMIAGALSEAGFDAIHEAKLAPRCRIDFLVGDVGIEVKQGEQPRKKLVEQARRYLLRPQLSALILVTTRGVNLPGRIEGKSVIVFGLNKLWGVALP